MTYLNKKIGRHFCIRFTEDDARIAIPMMMASILALVALL